MKFVDRFEEALSKGYIKAYFQPLRRSISGKICGAEALARWEDPKSGLIPPDEFINILEEHRLIHKLDLAMLENICRFYKKNTYKDMSFSINLSGIDFEETDMFREITEIMSRYDVPVNAVHLEITESTMLNNTVATGSLFDKFHNAGFEIWMDDFGSGFSSLNVLRNYDFDVLKIDMALIRKFDIRSRKIISSIVNMSKMLGIHTLAEGVETEEQLTFLRDIGCEIIQGYYFAKPMCESDFTKYLENNPAETKSEYKYWNDAGRINFLSADPFMISAGLTEKNGRENVFGTAPLAFIEYNNGRISYPYVNKAYIEQTSKIGYYSVEQMENDVNDDRFEYYDRHMRQIETTIYRGNVVKTDNIIGDVVYTFTTKLAASSGDKHLIAATVHTISSEKNDYLVLKYSQALYATYDLVTEITPDKDSAVQIYSNAGFNKVYGTFSLKKGIREFAANEVHPNDREKYLIFFDLNTLKERTKSYIQQPFRVRSSDGYELKNVRISKLENGKYLYTIQSI